MTEFVLQMQCSRDGYIASADGGFYWMWNCGDAEWPWDLVLKDRFNAAFRAADAILLSRPMLEEGYLAHWGGEADRNPHDPDFDFARRITQTAKIVPTARSIQASQPDVAVTHAALPEIILNEIHAGRSLICFGGAGLARALITARLPDRIEFYVNPVTLGDGVSLGRAGFDIDGYAIAKTQDYACGMQVTVLMRN